MELAELLGVRRGVTAVIGSGGKTSLLRFLGEELSRAGGRVLLCTTTKIRPFPGLPWLPGDDLRALETAAEKHSLLCAGAPLGTGKLTAPEIPMAELERFFDYVLVEADGAAGRPLKAHAPWEPVIPPEARLTVCVVGLGGLGLPIAETVHRPEIFAALAETEPKEPVAPELAAQVLLKEGLGQRYFLNQADTPERWEWGRRLSDALGCPAVIGALQKGVFARC